MDSSVTLADVAAAAGVSSATASRVLHGSAGRSVRADLADRVTQAAHDLGYLANAAAQAMARGTTTTVGLIVHDLANPYAAAIASGVMEAAHQRGLLLTIAAADFDAPTELAHLRALIAQRARAVIFAGSRFTDPGVNRTTRELLATLASAGGRAAVIGSNDLASPTVQVAQREAAAALATTLYSLGYRRFAILAGPEQLAASEERLAGFRQGLASCGIQVPSENIVTTQYTRDGGYVALGELLDFGLEVDAVFAVNDVMAIGAMAALKERGLSVPDDIALAGFDDIAMLRDISPALTTVRLPLADMGRGALELALIPADDEPSSAVIGGEVVVRDSTPPRTAPC